MARGSMNKDVSIRYTGDDKDFKKACDRVNIALKKQAAQIESQNAEMGSSFDKTTSYAKALIAVFATAAIASFFKDSIKLAADFAKAGGEMSDSAKNTISRLEDISLEWEAIKINIGETILEGNGLYKIIDKIGELSERIRKRGLLAGIFMGQEKFKQIEAEEAKWNVDRNGNPIAPVAGRRTLTEIKEQLKQAKELEKAEKERARAAEAAARAAAKELALREKLGKEYEKLFVKPNMPKSFEEWGKSQTKNYGGLKGGPQMPINEVTTAMEAQMNMVENLSGAFEDMFLNIDKGFKGMVESLIESIKKLVIQLAAKAAVLMLIRTLFPMSFGVGATTSLMNMFGPGMFSGGSIGGGKPIASLGMASQNINLGGEFKIRGSDLYASVSRHGNMLNGNT